MLKEHLCNSYLDRCHFEMKLNENKILKYSIKVIITIGLFMYTINNMKTPARHVNVSLHLLNEFQ